MSRKFPDDSPQHKAWMESRMSLKPRLRTMAETGWNPIGKEALNRIEELEGVLRFIYEGFDNHEIVDRKIIEVLSHV